jgi:photosystem II stability/assembly factor-like uncharacterized protein
MKTTLTTKWIAAHLLALMVLTFVLPTHAAALDSWQWSQPRPQGNDLNALIHAADRFVAVGEHGSILESVDGREWTVHNLAADMDLTSIAYGNGTFVIVGRNLVHRCRDCGLRPRHRWWFARPTE